MKKIFLFLLILLLLGIFFKPISISILEGALSSLLDTPVKTLQFNVLSLDLYASIKNEKNIAHIKVNSLYPLGVDVTYEGNIDAFKVYHPLKASSSLTGTVYYKDHLEINANLLTMDAKTRIQVLEKKDDWLVDVNISSLCLGKLQEENNISVDLDGKLDILLRFHTNDDSYLYVKSEQVKIHMQEYNDLYLNLKSTDDNLHANAIFSAPNIEYKGIWFNYDANKKSFDGKVNLRIKKVDNDFVLNIKGEHNKTKLRANLDGSIASSKLSVKNIIYDLNTSEARADLSIQLKEVQRLELMMKEIGISLQGDFEAKGSLSYKLEKLLLKLNTQSLGGNLDFKYDDGIFWKAEKLSLEKIAYMVKLKQNLSSVFNAEGSYVNNKIEAKLQSSKLRIDTTEIKDINISALGTLENINILTQAHTKDLDIKSSTLHLKELKFLNLQAKIDTAYTEDLIDINLSSSYKNKIVKAKFEAKSKELSLSVNKVKYEKKRLTGKYNLDLEPSLLLLKDSLNIKGSFSYDKNFELLALIKSFEKPIHFTLNGNQLKLHGTKFKLENLLEQAGQAPYAKGKLDFNIYGDFDNLEFSLKSQEISLNKKETGLDENLSITIKGRLNSDELYLWTQIDNKHLVISKGLVFYHLKKKNLNINLPLVVKNKNKSLSLILGSRLNTSKDISGSIELRNGSEKISLEPFLYDEEGFHSELKLIINNLSKYAPLFEQNLYGPLHLHGPLNYVKKKADIHLETGSFGGLMKINLQNEKLQINLENLSIKNVENIIKEKSVVKKGLLNGGLTYNLEAKDVEIVGIDIDKSLQEVQDVLGLNIFAMGSSLVQKRFSKHDDISLSTQVSELEFDVKITKDLIISKDIALATKKSRFAINMDLKRNGEIKDLEIAILDYKGCAILRQKLEGNIKEPELVNTKGTAVVILGRAPKEILKTGAKLVNVGAGLIDSTASFIWKKGLRQNSSITLVEDSLTKGANIFTSGQDLVVSGKCKIFYKGKVKHPH
ncbi:MAG TPA: hypothetical protein EYO73_06420 [Sulfurimonas sp.]|nr:hypothetical protein [Sulfurimonas sp.]